MYLNLKRGMQVTVTIRGCIHDVETDCLYLKGMDESIPTDTDMVTVTIDETPEHWPPLVGDIWRVFLDPEGHEDWHAVICRDYTGDASAVEVQMTPPTQSDADWRDPADLLALGALRLVWRDGKPVT